MLSSLHMNKIEINKQFEQALKLLEQSDKSLFITGKAGTGKSTLLEHFKEITKKKVAVLAPTGVAALNVQGQTIHSFFLIPPNITPDKVLEHKLSGKKKKLVQELDMIIIDEASMLRADLLDCIDVSLRYHRGENTLPFGGIQMVFIGDLYQLPPVVAGHEERKIFQTHYSSPYFFSAKSLGNFDVEFLELEKVYRQKDNQFIQLLNKIRDNSINYKDLMELNQRYKPELEPEDFVITLTTTNAAANKKNSEELAKLKTKSESFWGETEGDFSQRNLPTLEDLELKIGAQIMMLSNDPVGRWVNGSIGRITAIEFDLQESDDVLIIELNTGRTVKIAKHTWNINKYVYDEEKQKINTEIVGSFRQFPLRLAWAVTIHKSQGKTFDKVIIDIGRGAFAHGQVYVALSRCTNFKGIILKKPIEKRHIWMDYKINQFFRQLRSHQPISPLPMQSVNYIPQ